MGSPAATCIGTADRVVFLASTATGTGVVDLTVIGVCAAIRRGVDDLSPAWGGACSKWLSELVLATVMFC